MECEIYRKIIAGIKKEINIHICVEFSGIDVRYFTPEGMLLALSMNKYCCEILFPVFSKIQFFTLQCFILRDL